MLLPHVGEVFLSECAADGFECWQREQPDVILLEISMQADDGMGVAQRIKAVDREAAIIVMAASPQIEHLSQTINFGVDGYLFKPIEAVLLLDLVARSMRDRQRALDLRMGHMVFEVANEGILVTDEASSILAVNPAFSEITGYRPDEVIGRKTSLLSSGLHPPEFYRAMWASLKTHGRWSGEIINRRKDGQFFSEWLSIAAVDGEFQPARRYVGLISDISDRKREEEYIRRLAHFDSLTGLPNRVLFEDRLQRAMVRARRYRQRLALLYVDLDRFKEINDRYGHAVGDEALKIAAVRMQATLRQNDTVSRRGGDEFVVIVELNEHPEGIANVCSKLIKELCLPFPLNDEQIELGASIGVAIFPNDADGAESLLAAADAALYEAKTAGRGVFRLFEAEAQKNACTRMDMERVLREGLKEWRYVLHYLPEISLTTGKPENIEALLRFRHPEFGLLEASRFLEIAEEIGIMPEIGQRALSEAVRELLELRRVHADLGLVIDLSPRQLAAPDVVARLLDTLVAAGLPPQSITFECPESALTGNDAAMQTLYSLASSGCKFTLDDFGVGYCSFSLISQLPMSSIKIDRSFTREIETSMPIRELVAALIAFGRRLGMRTVAEGVETGGQLDFLRLARCDAVQGYMFGRPMDGDQLRAFLAPASRHELLCETTE